MHIDNIKLRRLKNTKKDYKLLEKWYQEEEIYLSFEQRKLSYNEIVNKYYERTLEDSKVKVYMIEYECIPIGIVQYQRLSNDNKKLYGIDINNCYEIDIFIGELRFHNKGIGKKVISLIVNYLFKEKNANILVMCPLKDNIKAIKCYLGCGFRIKNEFISKDTIGNIQEYELMIREK